MTSRLFPHASNSPLAAHVANAGADKLGQEQHSWSRWNYEGYPAAQGFDWSSFATMGQAGLHNKYRWSRCCCRAEPCSKLVCTGPETQNCGLDTLDAWGLGFRV